jgi:hypothetical protein
MVGWNFDSWENQQPAYRNLRQLIRDKTDCLYMMGFPAANRAPKTTVTKRSEGPKHVVRTVLHTPRGDLMATQYQLPDLNTVWRTERLLKTDEDVDRFVI